jgi:hypothetical protein
MLKRYLSLQYDCLSIQISAKFLSETKQVFVRVVLITTPVFQVDSKMIEQGICQELFGAFLSFNLCILFSQLKSLTVERYWQGGNKEMSSILADQ